MNNTYHDLVKQTFDFPQEGFEVKDNNLFFNDLDIKKLIDKAVNVRNRKYSRIIYVNANLNLTSIINTLEFLNQSYYSVKFFAKVLDPEDEFDIDSPNIIVVK